MAIKFKGVAIFMNGQQYIVPSLSLRQFREHFTALTEPIEAADGDGLFAQFKKYVPIIALALQRNYEDVTEEQLFDWLDLNTFRQTFLAVQAASGMKVEAPGE